MNFDEELQAIKDNLYAFEYAYPTEEQLKLLGSLISSRLSKPKIRQQRIEILNILAGDVMMDNFGIRITSSYNLTKWIVSYLIDKFLKPNTWELSDYGKYIIDRCAERAKARLKILSESN